MSAEHLGELIQKRRKDLAMTQADLAFASGVGVRFISELENGKETCQIGKAFSVLASLGLRLTAHPKEESSGRG